MTRCLGLIVTDASPLITLAAGEALECLTRPGVSVIIPDMVYAEVAEDVAKLTQATRLSRRWGPLQLQRQSQHGFLACGMNSNGRPA